MATIAAGMQTSYTDTTPQKRTITDLVSIISPKDTPIIAYFGIKSAPGPDWNLVNWPNTVVEMLEDELLPQSTTLNGSITSTATTITFTDADVYAVGDVVQLDSEYVIMVTRSASGEVWTVGRSFAGTTNASHADAITALLIGNARIEGAESDLSPTVDITNRTNYTQIIQAEIKVSRTQKKIPQYGIANTYEYQSMKKTQEALIKLEKSVIYGKVAAGSASAARMMGGLDYWINSTGGNTVSAGGAVTQAHFEDVLEACYNDGSVPGVAFVSPANMQVVKGWYDNSSYLRVPRDEQTVGMVIDKVHTPYGDLDLVMNRWIPNTFIPVVNAEHFCILSFDEFAEEPLAKTGDYERGQIIGEFTCLVRHPLKAHGEVIAIS